MTKMAQNGTNLSLDLLGAHSASNSFYTRAYNNYFENQEVATIATVSSERRKRLTLKRIVVSEHNYFALKRLGHAGDSFNDVISRLLRIYWNYQEKQQEQDSQKSDGSTSNGENLFPRNIFELLQLDREQLADVLGSSTRNNRNHQSNKQEDKYDSIDL